MNWMSRIAIFAVLGAILSSAVLVGCSSGGDEDNNAPANVAKNTADGG
ncbi:hypothetical protein IAD21_01803 [Abditibacteriota bacterium]|nr:hypothetical protein IAD21_01803 [Abditibacteriota bacterium]